jgi:hypothetical protein
MELTGNLGREFIDIGIGELRKKARLEGKDTRDTTEPSA